MNLPLVNNQAVPETQESLFLANVSSKKVGEEMALRLENSDFSIFENLRAQGPHPSYRDKLRLFGQFVGVWDLDVLFYDQDRKAVYRQPGEWSFAYVLDGRAIQDVLVYPNQEDGLQNSPGRRRIGTTLLFYDSRTYTWQMIWLGAVSGAIVVRTGRQVGDEIWIEGLDSNQKPTRSMFTEIAQDRFHWKDVLSHDGGGSWRMEQEMLARRRLT
jgi:hypothetical protein